MRHLRRLGHCLAAGALCGAALAPLQLLLWPDARPALAPALVAFALWSSWAAVWIGAAYFAIVEIIALTSPFLAARSGFNLGLWRWLTLANATLVACVGWWNREFVRDFLLPAWREALAVGASLATLFMVVMIWALVKRKWRHRPLAWGMGSSAVFVGSLWWLWTANPAPLPEPPLVVAPRFLSNERLLLVCWEGADLNWLLPAAERGDMPFLRSLRTASAWGQVRTVKSFVRPAALATLATGCSPAVHGMVSAQTYRLPWLSGAPVALLLQGPWPDPHQLPWRQWERAPEPPLRRAPVWEILARAGRRVGVVGWANAHNVAWSLPPTDASASVPYASLDAEFRAALDPALKAKPGRADATRAAFASAAAAGAGAALANARNPVDVLIVNNDLAARLRPMWTERENEVGQGDVLAYAARLLDDQLRELWSLMGGDQTLLVIVSPYGLAPPSPWRRLTSVFSGSRRLRVSAIDSPDGFVMFVGAGVRAGERLRGVRLPDVAATVLYLLELPVARDMAGKVVLEAISDERASTLPLRLVPCYPAVPAPERQE